MQKLPCKYLITFFIVVLVCMNYSCSERQIKSKISALQSAPIMLRVDKMVCLSDSIETAKNEYLKWIVYHDSSVCKPCQISHILDWDKIKSIKDIECIFIFSAKSQEIDEYREALKNSETERYVYLDTAGIFPHDNPNIPHETLFHKFLIDKDNRVLLVGNPLTNKQIYEMFIKILKEKNIGINI